MDPSIKLLTLTGKAGCGKTLLAIAAGLEQLSELNPEGTYQKLIVSRPVQPVGRDIGFLPGSLAEKMEPWIAPVRDNLEFLLSNQSGKKGNARKKKLVEENSGGAPGITKDPYLQLLQQKGLIEVEAITFIRGRSIPNAFIIIDEAQNLSMHELKTIVTRAGEGTKIILTGDIEQIDNVHVDTFTNGLTHAVEKFKDYDLSGHVTLLKGERSELATLASKIL
jgi:PhoH-like ATPase